MRRCLVIDDSPLIRKVARMILERQGVTVRDADSLLGGLEMCKSEMPDLILLDWHVPGGTTSEFMTALRGLSLAGKPYVIYCTTENDPLDIARAMNVGCDDVLMKPFTRSDLEAKLICAPKAA